MRLDYYTEWKRTTYSMWTTKGTLFYVDWCHEQARRIHQETGRKTEVRFKKIITKSKKYDACCLVGEYIGLP